MLATQQMDLTDSELEIFKELAQSACVRGGGCNLEVALDFLYESEGDLLAAIGKLIAYQPNVWTQDEVQYFERLLAQYGKNFLKISQEIKSKSVKECVEFYYQWKRYNMKWRNGHHATEVNGVGGGGGGNSDTQDLNNNQNGNQNNNHLKSSGGGSPLRSEASTSSLASNSDSPSLPVSPTPSERPTTNNSNNIIINNNNNIQPQQEQFPCKVCGRTFEKIKSRSAHMKRHKNGR